jgi:orotidine-5'-phosphate decarboxylase
MDLSEKLIVALDFNSKYQALSCVDRLLPAVKNFKVGKQLFTHCGPSVIEAIHKKGGQVFFDSKYHDIPNTVAGASAQAAKMGVWMFNIHAMGGFEMMRASWQAIDNLNLKTKPLLIAVTVLTSMDGEQLKNLGIHKSTEDLVLDLAKSAKEAGCDGVVASALEVKKIKRQLGKDFIVVTPGIKFEGQQGGSDQKRVATVEQALTDGSDYLVVGRSLLNSKDPVQLLNQTAKRLQ